MSQTEKNQMPEYHKVPVDNQVKFESCFLFNEKGTGLRVLYLGNSITYTQPGPEIGWYGNWGMAASAPEKDYVHLCQEAINSNYPDSAFAIAQVAAWEMRYKNPGDILEEDYETCRNFNADVIVVRSVENCPREDFAPEVFRKEYKRMLDYFNPGGKARYILTDCFVPHPGDEVIRQVAEERGYPMIHLGDMNEDDSMKAIGKFEHRGVAGHPGDKGMRTIADRIINAMKIEGILT